MRDAVVVVFLDSFPRNGIFSSENNHYFDFDSIDLTGFLVNIIRSGDVD